MAVIELNASSVAAVEEDDEEDDSTVVIVVYCVLFVMACVGNVTVFVALLRKSNRKSQIILLVTHLAVADLIVTFVMIPIEVGWKITKQWRAGNVGCKIVLFIRPFGLYLSSYVLICITMDRYFAILHPLSVTDSRRRGKIMLAVAWVMSALCSIPQSFVFHLAPHPTKSNYYQCVSFGFFSTNAQEITYNIFSVCVMYFLPLINIIFVYTCILWKIYKKSRLPPAECDNQGRLHLRRSDMRNIERARKKTMRMTLLIVVVFIFCWTPYVFMTLWYMFDRNTAEKVDRLVQDSLFLMAVSNSIMNPLVYGSYAIDFRQEYATCLHCLLPRKSPFNRKSTVGSNLTRSTAVGVAPLGSVRRPALPLKLQPRPVPHSACDSTPVSQDTSSLCYRLAAPHHSESERGEFTAIDLHHGSPRREEYCIVVHNQPTLKVVVRHNPLNRPPVTTLLLQSGVKTNHALPSSRSMLFTRSSSDDEDAQPCRSARSVPSLTED